MLPFCGRMNVVGKFIEVALNFFTACARTGAAWAGNVIRSYGQSVIAKQIKKQHVKISSLQKIR
jgi:hypothetical protein